MSWIAEVHESAVEDRFGHVPSTASSVRAPGRGETMR